MSEAADSDPSNSAEPAENSAELDELVGQYNATLRRIGALPELPMRRAAVGNALDEFEPDEAVWWIDQLVRGALWGRAPEIDAMLACSDYLVRLRVDDAYDRIQALYMAAADADRESVLMLLRDPPPHRALRAGGRLPEVRMLLEREISVGERRSIARGQDRQLLERLLMDPNVLVLEKLLENPSLVIEDVLTVASRRPTTPDLLQALSLTTRWFTEHRVREALVQNPYILTGVALKLLPTLHVQTLRRIRNAGDLHPAVHETAGMLVRLREERTAPWRV